MPCYRKQHPIPTRLALLIWAVMGRAAQGTIEASVVYRGLLLALALAIAIAARGIYFTPQYLDKQLQWPGSWIHFVSSRTDKNPTRAIHHLSTTAAEFKNAVFILYLFFAELGGSTALESSPTTLVFAAVIWLARIAPLLRGPLDGACWSRIFLQLSKTCQIRHIFKRTRVLIAPLVILALVSPTAAALTRSQCARNNCVQRRKHGIMCFYPGATDILFSSSPRECTSSRLRRMLDIHRSKDSFGPSIVHYELHTHEVLGGASFTLRNLGPQTDIVVCATGAHSRNYGGQLFETRCWLPEADDDLGDADGDRACSIVHERSRPLERVCNLLRVQRSNSTAPARPSGLVKEVLRAFAHAEAW